jgi:hypothetical protein
VHAESLRERRDGCLDVGVGVGVRVCVDAGAGADADAGVDKRVSWESDSSASPAPSNIPRLLTSHTGVDRFEARISILLLMRLRA